jgi:hypothetical protein
MTTGYKGTYNFTCLDHKFEIGKTYELSGTPIPCVYGFHYCVNPKDVLEYYSIKHNFRLLEIEDLGESIIDYNKSVTNKIRIVREVLKEEYYQLLGFVNNELTITDKYGYWKKHEFDERNNCIRYENSNGYWEKREYDERNNCICVYSDGYWFKHEYDERNNCIYYATLSEFWTKHEYDERNNEVRFENSYGYWFKREFDERDNCIYF